MMRTEFRYLSNGELSIGHGPPKSRKSSTVSRKGSGVVRRRTNSCRLGSCSNGHVVSGTSGYGWSCWMRIVKPLIEWSVVFVSEVVSSVIFLVLSPFSGWFRGWLRWCPTSMTALQNAERRLLGYLKTAYTGKYIDVGNRVGNKDNRVWTIALNEKNPNTPLVLVHGFAAGVGLWVLNLDALAKDRPVYAFDILGFGRSSRPNFSSDAREAESQLVDSIEDWREQMKIDKFILLGHSMGGFLATAYSLKYPNSVKQVILADPWGFPLKPDDQRPRQIPMWVKAVVTLLKPFNPLAAIRVAGPWGPRLIEKFRPDLTQKFISLTDDTTETNVISNYLYHCNAQTPSGEAAFKTMTESFGWAKWPMISRIGHLRSDVPLSIIYGSRSWIDRQPGFQIKQERPESHVNVHVISGAGHHVYADQPSVFNNLVHGICNAVDGLPTEEDLLKPPPQPQRPLVDDESSVPSDMTVSEPLRSSTPSR